MGIRLLQEKELTNYQSGEGFSRSIRAFKTMSRWGESSYSIKYIYSSLLPQCHGKLDLDKHEETNKKVRILNDSVMKPTLWGFT